MSYLPEHYKNLTLEINQSRCLDAINLTLKPGGITAIAGPNGAGQTLLLKLLAGLITPSSGTIEWQQTPQPPVITFVPQTPVLLKRSVYRNIELPLVYNGLTNTHERCQQVVEWAGISHLIRKAAHALSTGEQQLVALARAWALSPNVLLLDEPCENFSLHQQDIINQQLDEWADSCKIILSSHNDRQIKQLATDTVLLNNDGTLIHQSYVSP